MKSVKDLEVYRKAMDLGEEIWDMIAKWDYFAKDTLGKQLVRCADSVALNISEGYGRYHYKENKNFCYYSRGSIIETQTCVEKAVRRNLMDGEAGRELYTRLENLKKRLNNYINSIGPKS